MGRLVNGALGRMPPPQAPAGLPFSEVGGQTLTWVPLPSVPFPSSTGALKGAEAWSGEEGRSQESGHAAQRGQWEKRAGVQMGPLCCCCPPPE